MNEKRVTIFKNGINTRGLVFRVPSTLNELIRETSVTFNAEIKKIFIEDGSEVKDISFIRAFDKLYVSDGEAFILPPRFNKDPDDWITLNVGGKYFTTSRSTLTRKEPKSMLARMFCEENSDLLVPSSVDRNGAFLIDRSPKYFEPILNFLRCGQLVYDKHINPVGILEEAKYFGIESIISTLEQNINQHKTSRDNLPLTRRDVINALITTSYTAELRFQGVNLSGADLSKLDLRFINFKYANLQECNLKGSNLSWCCLERADLKNAVLDNAQLLGVKCSCANLEGVSMKSCNLKDPAGSRTNMEGVNLKGANLEESDMGGVNLRVATLKNANLKNCDLRGAVFAGADLENCDLSGSDLHEANLRGANLKNAAFELMQTPLHMSQTIR